MGAGGAVGGALVIGFARGVYWVMNSANINATIVYNATQLLKGLPPLAAAIGIVILVSFINGLIPSGSGKGALLAPIIVPIAMELGLTSQTAVLGLSVRRWHHQYVLVQLRHPDDFPELCQGACPEVVQVLPALDGHLFLVRVRFHGVAIAIGF